MNGLYDCVNIITNDTIRMVQHQATFDQVSLRVISHDCGMAHTQKIATTNART